MFEDKLIQSDVLRAVPKDNGRMIYSMDLRLPFYRSVPLSCVETIEVALDDKLVEIQALRFCYDNCTYQIQDLKDLMHIWWGLTVPAKLSIETASETGRQQVKVRVTLKLRWPVLIPSGSQDLENYDTNNCQKVMKILMEAPKNAAIKAKQAVSIYSFTKEFYEGYYSLEDCLRSVAELGIQGLEIVNTQHIFGFPNPTREFIDSFRMLVSRYGLVAVSYGTYTDNAIRTHGRLTREEMSSQLFNDIRLAKELGFPLIRIGPNTPLEVLVDVLPKARETRVKIGVEIHAPITVSGPQTQQLIQLIKDGNGDILGLVPDFSCFASSVPEILLQKVIGMGVPAELAQLIANAYGEGISLSELKENVHKMGLPKEVDELIDLFYHIVVRGQPEELKAIMPFVNHIHAKFWSLDENDDEVSIPYKSLMKIVSESGYSGYLSSEYEGYDADTEYRGKELVRRHQNMMQKYL